MVVKNTQIYGVQMSGKWIWDKLLIPQVKGED